MKSTNNNGPQIYSLNIDDYYNDNDDNNDEVDSLIKEINGNDIHRDDDDDDDDNMMMVRNGTKSSLSLSSSMVSSNYYYDITTSTIRNFHFRQRVNNAVKRVLDITTTSSTNNNDTTTTSTTISQRMKGYIRSQIGNRSLIRNYKIILLCVVMCIITIIVISPFMILKSQPDIIISKFNPHSSSYGGSLNENYNMNVPNDYDDSWYNKYINSIKSITTTTNMNNDPTPTDSDNDMSIPIVSNIGTKVQSISIPNIINKQAHYIHDPMNDPYTSPYYAMWGDNTTTTTNNDVQQQQQQRQKEQDLYTMKMMYYKQIYGQWISPNYDSTTMTIPNFTTSIYPNMDLPMNEFPSSSWQLNTMYVNELLEQGKQLVQRVKEGIYEEYGYGIMNITSTIEKNNRIAQRLEQFKVHVYKQSSNNNILIHNGMAVASNNKNNNNNNDDDDTSSTTTTNQIPIPSIAYLTYDAWEMLIRKLLHCMITHDEFYIVQIGHTNTYFSNNMYQSSIMVVNHILEPIFNKLGMNLIVRNMGMNATTTVSAMGGADIYGEMDILWHTPDPRSPDDYDTTANVITESYPMIDLLFRQAILSGERVPIILTPEVTFVLEEMNYEAWVGNIQPGATFCDETYTKKNKIMVPPIKACRFVKCRSSTDPNICYDKHNSVCWINRTDIKHNDAISPQNRNVGYQTGYGYPSVQQQQLEGRKLTMLILHALDEAFERWRELNNNNNENDNGHQQTILSDDMWHVHEQYNTIRDHVRNSKSGMCGRLVQRIDPRICHMSMHAYTEWTPRVNPINSRIKTLINVTNNNIPIADNHKSMIEIYTEVALLPPQWKIPYNDTDVHMIAIATNDDAMIIPSSSTNNNKGPASSNTIDTSSFSSYNDDGTLYLPNPNYDDNNAADHDQGFDDDKYRHYNKKRKHHRHRRRQQQHHHNRRSSREVMDFAKYNSGSNSTFVKQQHRSMLTSDISPKMWTVYNAPLGYCDGSAQSTCNRNGYNKCLLANYNHYRAGIIGHGSSGKLVLSLPNVREGLILARFEWREENGPRVRLYPPDYVFEYTINGVKNSMTRMQFARAGIDITQDVRIHVLFKDTNYHGPQTVTIEMEVRSTIAGTFPLLLLSHLYYA